MSVKRAIVAAAATLTIICGAASAATLPANAETSDCGSTCIDLYGGIPATLGHASYLLASYQQSKAIGNPIILSRVSGTDPAQDFRASDVGTVSEFYQAGLVSAGLDQLYGGDAMDEIQYTPSGLSAGVCVGVAATATAGEDVTLQPCGASVQTFWIVDSSGSITGSFFPLINASTPDANAADPFVLTYPPGASPTNTPNPQLEVDSLQESAAGQVAYNQLWSALFGPLVYSDADLTIAQPANVTTDATGPSGAKVTYPLPAVTDPDDTAPTAVCVPASGSVFPIGTTTVTCTATDANDLNGPVHATFTVTVTGAAAQLSSLRQAVQGLGFGNFLTGTLARAQRQLSAGHPFLACLTLSQFILEVRLETPWFIPASTAAPLIADAKRVQAVLGGCGHRPPF